MLFRTAIIFRYWYIPINYSNSSLFAGITSKSGTALRQVKPYVKNWFRGAQYTPNNNHRNIFVFINRQFD
jgi:hypothetical protein